jgi:hypothetical protein
MTTPDPNYPTIGWRERVDLPDWGLRRVKCKIDTGARTSAIDVAEIQELGDGTIRFKVVARVRPKRRVKWVQATPVRLSTVKPSHGEAQQRYVCETTLRVGEHEHKIEISLVCRKGMLCRMLLGRTAMAGQFLVDPEKKYLMTGKRVSPTE